MDDVPGTEDAIRGAIKLVVFTTTRMNRTKAYTMPVQRDSLRKKYFITAQAWPRLSLIITGLIDGPQLWWTPTLATFAVFPTQGKLQTWLLLARLNDARLYFFVIFPYD